jgi:hypothetical protein
MKLAAIVRLRNGVDKGGSFTRPSKVWFLQLFVIVWIGRGSLVIYEILRPLDCLDRIKNPGTLSVIEKTAQVI